jgi:hypothetical protein
MSAPIRPGSPSERTPASVPRSAIMDEARITRFSPNGVCVAVRMRTDVDVDVPLTEYDVEINGVRASVDREEVSYAEYDYTGERTKVAADFVSNHAAGSFRMTEREARKFRVVERRGEVCGAPPRDGKVVLQLVIPQDDHRGNWGEKFIWTVERKALTSGEVVATPSSTPSEPEPKAAPSPSPSPAVLPTAPPSDPSSVPGTYSL